jgi:prepilin signal peptidase PulO-like enzyme (type II secretory pathway)
MATEEINSDKGQDKGIALSEGIILAAVPVVAYLFAFVFEAGYATVFGIPIQFITLGLTNVFVVGGSLLLVTLILLIIADLATMVLRQSENPIYRRLSTLAPLLFASFGLLLLEVGTPLRSALIGLLVGWLLIIFFQFVFPILSQRGESTYHNKLLAQELHDARMGGLFSSIARRYGGVYQLIYFLAIALFVTYYAGQADAFRERTFLVTESVPECVVLRIYGDEMVCAPFDRSTRKVEPRFTLLRLSANPIPSLRREQVGPLILGEIIATPSPTNTSTPVPTLLPSSARPTATPISPSP